MGSEPSLAEQVPREPSQHPLVPIELVRRPPPAVPLPWVHHELRLDAGGPQLAEDNLGVGDRASVVVCISTRSESEAGQEQVGST